MMALLRVEIKRMMHAIPKFLGMAVLLLALTAVLTVGAFALFETEEDSKIKVALTMPPTDENIGGLVINALEGMQSVEDAIEIIYADEVKGDVLLKDGEVSAHIIVPDGFLNGVIYGENTPAKVKLRDGSSMECVLTVNGLDSASQMLKISQGGVFALFDATKAICGESTDLDAVLTDANLLFIDLVFKRGAMFKIKNTAMTGELSTIEFVLSSSVVLVLLLTTTAILGMFGRENKDYYKRLSTLNVKGFSIAFSKFGAASVLLFTVAVLLSALLILTDGIYEKGALIMLIPVIAVCSAFAVLIQAVMNNKTASVMTAFILTLGMMFASGGIIPDAFLSETLLKISEFLPVYPMLETVRGIFKANGEYMMWQCVVYTLIMLALASLSYSFRLRRGKL